MIFPMLSSDLVHAFALCDRLPLGKAVRGRGLALHGLLDRIGAASRHPRRRAGAALSLFRSRSTGRALKAPCWSAARGCSLRRTHGLPPRSARCSRAAGRGIIPRRAVAAPLLNGRKIRPDRAQAVDDFPVYGFGGANISHAERHTLDEPHIHRQFLRQLRERDELRRRSRGSSTAFIFVGSRPAHRSTVCSTSSAVWLLR